MKHLLSATVGAALVVGLGIGDSSIPAFAAATPSSFSVDCDSDATLSSATTIAGLTADKVISGVVGDTFTVTNTAADGLGDCTVVRNSSVSTSGTSIADANGTLVFTITRSGTFTIAPAGGNPVTFFIDACSLQGSGIEADPWLVATPADFQNVGDKIGTSSCSLSGHYLQTANLSLQDHSNDNVWSTDLNSGNFSGVFDGDHYQIVLGGTGSGGWAHDSNGPTAGGYSELTSLFDRVYGTVKRVRVSGEFNTSRVLVGGLANMVVGGGVISEVESSVTIRSARTGTGASGWPGGGIGGLVGRLGNDSVSELARIEYSKFHGTIYWAGSEVTGGVGIGGIAGSSNGGVANGPQVSEIRDSYSRMTAVYQTDFSGNGADLAIGGLVGLENGNNLLLLRSYAASSFSDQAPIANQANGKLGGLIGMTAAPTNSYRIISSFWLAPVPTATVGQNGDGPDGIVVYTTTSPVDLPRAVGVSASELQTLSTFTTKQLGSTGDPGGDEIPVGTDEVNDYRWAITTERSTFVPSKYGSIGDFTTRELWDNPASNPKSYQTLRRGVLSDVAHGGYDPISTVTYASLGNVWEICPGEDYPTLVWEEETCGGGNTGTSAATPSTFPGGLSAAEYAEFLRSGLTLEQFLAKRLAATGVGSETLLAGALGGILLAALGMTLITAGRRRRMTAPR